MQKLLARFFKRESGSVTLETVLWIPVYFILAALVINATSIVLTQARMKAVVTEAARYVAIGYYTEEQGIAHILDEAYSVENFTANISVTGRFVTASVTMPFNDLIGLRAFDLGDGVFGASARFVSEI